LGSAPVSSSSRIPSALPSWAMYINWKFAMSAACFDPSAPSARPLPPPAPQLAAMDDCFRTRTRAATGGSDIKC
jgi:hypothetical protein